MKPLVYLVFTLMAFAVIVGCKKDSSKNKNDGIAGTWENKQIYPNASGRSQVYTFNSDGTFETHLTAFNPVNNQTLGYVSKSMGKYVLTGDQLSFSDVTYYGIKNYDANTPAVPESQLVIVTQTFTEAYSVSYNAKRDSLGLIIHCPLNANCIGLLWYKKQ